MMLRFGTNLEYLRKLNKMEQKDVAKIVNKSLTYLALKKCTSFVPETIKKEGKVALTQRRITVC